MKKFHWILLGGLLMAAPQIAQAQAPQSPDGTTAGAAGTATTTDNGAITNTTTTTTTTGGVAPDGSTTSGDGGFIAPDDAAMGDSDSDSSSSMPNTGGEPMIAVLAGLSIAGAAVAMRRKVTA